MCLYNEGGDCPQNNKLYANHTILQTCKYIGTSLTVVSDGLCPYPYLLKCIDLAIACPSVMISF